MQINLIQLERTVETASAKAAAHPSWLRAIDKAAEQLISNPYIAEPEDGLLILSHSGETYPANGVCQCRAFAHDMPCWHRAAAQLVKRYKEQEAAPPCPSPKFHPVPKCLAMVSCNFGQQRYIPFPKFLKLKANEFWRMTGR